MKIQSTFNIIFVHANLQMQMKMKKKKNPSKKKKERERERESYRWVPLHHIEDKNIFAFPTQ